MLSIVRLIPITQFNVFKLSLGKQFSLLGIFSIIDKKLVEATGS